MPTLDELIAQAGQEKPATSVDINTLKKNAKESYTTPTNQPFFPEYNKVKEGELTKYDLRGDIGPEFDEMRETKRAQEQTAFEEAGNAALRVIPKAGLQILETAGNIGDIEGWAGAIAGYDTDYTNWLSSWAKDRQEDINEALPIYRENRSDALDMSDSAWWAENIGGVAESAAAFAVTGMGLGAAIGKGAQALNASKLAFARNLGTALGRSGQALSTAALTHAEGVMTGVDVYKQVLEKKLQESGQLQPGQTLSYEELAQYPTDEEAANAASTAVRFNYLNLALNYTSLSPIFKGKQASRGLVDDALKPLAGETGEQFAKRIQSTNPISFRNTLETLGKEMPQEALEEGINIYAQNQGLYRAGMLTEDQASLGASLFSDEGLASMLMGALGGAGQTGALIAAKGKSNNKAKAETFAAQAEQIISNHEEGYKLVKNLQSINTLQESLAQAKAEGNEEYAEVLKKQIADSLAYSNFELGTTEALNSQLDNYLQMTPAQMAEEGLIEKEEDAASVRSEITQTKQRIKESEKVYNRVKEINPQLGRNYTQALYQNRTINNVLLQEIPKTEAKASNAMAKLNLEASANDLMPKSSQLGVMAGNLNFYTEENFDSKTLNEIKNLESYKEAEKILTQQTQMKEALKKNNANFQEMLDPKTVKEYESKLKEASVKATEFKEKVVAAENKVKASAKKEVTKQAVKAAPMVNPFGEVTEASGISPEVEPAPVAPVPAQTVALADKVQKLSDALEGTVDLLPSTSGEQIQKRLALMMEIKEDAAKEGYTTPESIVQYFADKLGKDKVNSYFETGLKPLLVQSFEDPSLNYRTFEDMFASPEDITLTKPVSTETDIESGEYYGDGLSSKERKKREGEIKLSLNNAPQEDGANTVRDTDNKVVYLGDKLVSAFNKFAYSSREYAEDTATVKGVNYHKIEDASNELADNFEQLLLSNKEFNPGTTISLEVLSRDTFIPFKDKTGKTVTFDDLIAKGYEDYVPIAIKHNNKIVGYVHDIDYINPSRVVETTYEDNTPIDNIAKNKAELRALRAAIIEAGKLNATIDSKTLGVLFTTKETSVASEAILDPKAIVTIAKSDYALTNTQEGTVGSNISDNLLWAQFTPGAIYYLAQTQGKYFPVPLQRNLLSADKVSSMSTIIRAWLLQDPSLVNVNPTVFDVTDINQVKQYVEQFVYLKSGLSKAFPEIVASEGSKNYFNIETVGGGTIEFVRNGGRGFKLSRNTPKAELDKFLAYMEEHLGAMYQSFSTKNFPSIEFMNYDGTEFTQETIPYNQFILQNTRTVEGFAVKEHELPNGEFTAFHQKTIGFSVGEAAPAIQPVAAVTETKPTKKAIKQLGKQGKLKYNPDSTDYMLLTSEQATEVAENTGVFIKGFEGRANQQKSIVKWMAAMAIDGNTFRDIMAYLKQYTDPEIEGYSEEQAAEIQKILDNKSAFLLQVNKRLQQLSRFEINDSEGLDSEDSEGTNEKINEKEDFEYDPFERTSKELREVFATVLDMDADGNPRTNYIGLNVYKDANDVISQLQALASVISPESVRNTDMFKAILTEMSADVPWLQSIVDILDEKDPQIAIKLSQFLSKHFVNQKTGLWNRGGASRAVTFRLIDTNQSSVVKTILNKWIENQKMNGFVTFSDGEYKVNEVKRQQALTKYKALLEKPEIEYLQEWLSDIGVEMSLEALDALRNSASSKAKFYDNLTYNEHLTKSNGWFNLMYQRLSNKQELEDTILQYNPLADNSGIRKLAGLEARYGRNNTTNSFRNGTNKSIYAYSNNKFAVIQLDRIVNDPAYVQSLVKSSFSSTSLWLNELTNENSSLGRYLALDYIDTIRKSGTSQDGVPLEEMTDAEHELFKMGAFFNQGTKTANGRRIVHTFYPTMSDKKTMLIMRTLAQDINLIFTGEKYQFSNKTIEAVYSLVEGERKRIEDYQMTGEDGNIDAYGTGADKFFLFPGLNYDVIPEAFKNRIYNAEGKLNITPEAVKAIKDYLDFYLKEKIEQQVAEWKRLELITEKNGTPQLGFLDKTYVENELKRFDTNGQKITFAAADYVVNSIISNGNIMQAFVGDPAMYWKTDVQETLVNIGKRLASEIAPGYDMINSENNSYTQAFVNDSKGASVSIAYLRSILGDEAKAYEKITGTDAQEYTTLEEHLYVLYHSGKLKEQQYKDLLAKTKGKEEFTDEELGILQPMKPVYRELVIKNNLNVPVYVKTASFPLVPQLTRGLEIDKIREAMEAQKVDRLVFKSGAKVGGLKSRATVYDGANVSDKIELASASLTLPRSGFRIQQEVPYDKDKNKINLVSQASKLITADLPARFKPLIEKYLELNKKIYADKREGLFEDFDVQVHTDRNGKEYYSYDLQKVAELIQKEGVERNYNMYEIAGFNIEMVDGKPRFVIPPYFNPAAKRMESLLTSLIDSRVRKQKITGFSGILGSEEGFKGVKDYNKLSNKEKSNIVFTDSFNHEVGLTNNQILVPFKFRDIDGKLLDVRQFVTPEGKLSDDVPQELLTIIGFRIPNQGKNSMKNLEIAGFLPAYMGDLVIASRDLTVQMGSDFDVDKLYMYMYGTVYDKGKIRRITLEDVEQADKVLATVKSKVSKEDYEYFMQAATEEEIDLLDSASNFEDEVTKKAKYISKLGKIGVYHNEIIDIFNEILSDKEIQKQVLQPLGFGKLADLKAEMLKLNPPVLESPLLPTYNRNKYIAARGGKALTGVFSVSNTFNAVLQAAKTITGNDIYFSRQEKIDDTTVIVEDPLEITQTGNKLSTPESLDGNFKSLVHAAFQSAAVDNEKEQILEILNINTQTAQAIVALAQSGFAEDEIVYLINQPSVVEYTTLLRNSSDTTKSTRIANPESVFYKQVLKKYAKEEEALNYKLTLTNMRDAIASPSALDFDKIQAAALEKFIIAKERGKQLQQVASAINADSAGTGKSLLDTQYKQEQIERLFANVNISNIGDIVGHTSETPQEGYIKVDDKLYINPTTIPGMATLNAVFLANQLFSYGENAIMPYTSDVIKSAMNEVFKLADVDSDLSASRAVEKRRKINDFMLGYIFSMNLGLYEMDVNAERARLFFDTDTNTSLAKRVIEAKANFRNSFLQRLETDIQKDDKPSLVKFNAATGELVEDLDIYQGFADLISNPATQQLGEDLVKYAYIEGGVQQATQFVKYVPLTYLQATGFASNLHTLGFNNTAQFGIVADPMYGEISRPVLQYFQHNAGDAPRVDISHLSEKVKEAPDTFTIKLDEQTNYSTMVAGELMPLQLVSIEKYVKADNKDRGKLVYYLYKFNEENNRYERLDTLGTFGMKELNASHGQTSLVKDNQTGEITPVKNPVEAQALNKTVKNPLPQEKITEEFGLTKGTLSTDTLDYIIETSPNAFAKEIAKLMKENFDKLPTITVQLGTSNSFDYGSNVLTINKSKPKEEMETAILHELIHAFTSAVLVNPTTSTQKTIVANLNGIRNALIKKYQADPMTAEEMAKFEQKYNKYRKDKTGVNFSKEELSKYYATLPEGRGIRELVTMAMTDPGFQKILSEISFNSDMSLWDKFLDSLLNILNTLGFKVDKNSALAVAIKDTVSLIKEDVNPFVESAVTNKVTREYTPENVTPLKPNEVFVFGSNTEGRHGKGAALIAKNNFGAVYGQSKGPQGQSYAIITKDLSKGTKSIPLNEILTQLHDFRIYASQHPDTKFYVTKLGSSLAGYSIEEIKALFKKLNETGIKLPDNIVLPKEYEVREEDLLPETQGLGMTIPEFMRSLTTEERAEFRRLREEGIIKTKCK